MNLFIRLSTCFIIFLFLGNNATAQYVPYKKPVHPPKGSRPKKADEFFVGVATIDEDANTRFFTYGGDISYMHPIGYHFGLTADAAAYVAKHDSVNYTIIQPLVGISILTGKGTERVVASPHLLAGLNVNNAKYSGNSFTSTSFAIAFGTDIRCRVSNKINVGVKADYNPVFGKHGTAHNLRFAAGWVLMCGNKGKAAVKK